MGWVGEVWLMKGTNPATARRLTVGRERSFLGCGELISGFPGVAQSGQFGPVRQRLSYQLLGVLRRAGRQRLVHELVKLRG